MPQIRQEFQTRRGSATAAEAVDLTTYDVLGYRGTNGQVNVAGNGEKPDFLFTSTASVGEVVSFAYLTSGMRAAVVIAGTVSAGQKLSSNANGRIVASGTAENAPRVAGDFAVALQDGVDTDKIEIDILGA